MVKRWYIVHAYTNFERKVADAIRERAKQAGLEHLFDEIVVPTEEVVEVRRGRKVQAERKFLPGYVLVKMEMTDPAFLLIKNTPKVTGFLGADNKAMPISDDEAMRDPQPGRGRDRAAEADDYLRGWGAGAGGGWSVCVVFGLCRRGRRRACPAQGRGVDLRASDPR